MDWDRLQIINSPFFIYARDLDHIICHECMKSLKPIGNGNIQCVLDIEEIIYNY